MIPTDKTLPAPDPRQKQAIESYGPGRFRVSGVEHRGAIQIVPSATAPWLVDDAVALAPDNLALVMGQVPAVEILVVGCGARAVFVPPSVRAAFKARGIVLDVMETGAACRTWGVLLAEGRRAAAALMPL